MRYQRMPHQYDLFSSQAAPLTVEALPMVNQDEAILLLGRLLYEIVQVEMKTGKMEGGNEQDHC